MIREDVFRLVSVERDYQDSFVGRKAALSDKQLFVDDADTSVAAWIIYMEIYLASAKQAICDLDESAALERIRKVTALGVACMEHNETKPRFVEGVLGKDTLGSEK